MSLSSFLIIAKGKYPFAAALSHTFLAQALGTEIHQVPVSPEFSNVISFSLNLSVRFRWGWSFSMYNSSRKLPFTYLIKENKVSGCKERE